MKSNGGNEAATVFKGIKGLIASGKGMTKKVQSTTFARPEKNQGAMIKQEPMKKMPTMGIPAKPAGVTKPMGGHKPTSIVPLPRPEGTIKRDSAKTIKPNPVKA